MTKSLPKSKFSQLKKKLHRHRKRARVAFVARHESAARWLAQKSLPLAGMDRSKRLLTSASLFGTLLLSAGGYQPRTLPPKTLEQQLEAGVVAGDKLHSLLGKQVAEVVDGQSIGQLDPKTQAKISDIISRLLGIDANFDLNGIQLNHAYGWMGYEQHLQRFPGDTLGEHDEEQVAGIAPGRGAWGYFADSRSQLTEKEVMREKYYVAVQTLYMPEWNTRTKELYDWFKYRKVVVINPDNGKVVVGVVGDAGPAQWTGKQFGGSPELMKELDLHLGPRKGKVLLLFLDDSEDKIPLGPLDYNVSKGQLEEA